MARSTSPLGSYPHNCSSGELGLALIYFLGSMTPMIESVKDMQSFKESCGCLSEIGNIRVSAIQRSCFQFLVLPVSKILMLRLVLAITRQLCVVNLDLLPPGPTPLLPPIIAPVLSWGWAIMLKVNHSLPHSATLNSKEMPPPAAASAWQFGQFS